MGVTPVFHSYSNFTQVNGKTCPYALRVFLGLFELYGSRAANLLWIPCQPASASQKNLYKTEAFKAFFFHASSIYYWL